MIKTPAETRISFESSRDIAASLVPDLAKASANPESALSENSDLSVFRWIAETNFWGSAESISGSGSTLEETRHLRNELALILAKFNIRSIVDAPTGDMNWMRHLDYVFERFVGIDIVENIIKKLKRQSFPPSHYFQTGNIVTDILPKADLLFCRDCMVHLPFSSIAQAHRLWKQAGFTYVMTTTFPESQTNEDCKPGDWRRLNLQRPPFNWPEPMAIFREYSGALTAGLDKSLGLWEMSMLP